MDPNEMIKGTPAEKHWQDIGTGHHHGILLPLIAIHSASSCGCGEFYDLHMLIDWIASLGMDILQLLPLNDSGPDPSPYNAQSASAIHPIYLSLDKLPLLTKQMKDEIAGFRAFNKTVRVHYTEVLEKKLEFLKKYVAATKEHFQSTDEYKQYVAATDWLNEYALFKVLKERFEGLNWIAWPEEFRAPSKTMRRKLEIENKEELSFHYILQYLCYLQLRGVLEYGKSKGVHIKGDIPILISPDSSDVWAHPELFDMTLAAGAPPDKFNDQWQYWGFPLYNWKAHREENFRYWKSRLHYASHFYSIYRIDHVVGFFRIWATKRGKHAKYGKFIPEDRRFWLAQGEEILRMMLSSCEMLPIAEDLGVVPDDVKERILSLGIPGTRVFRWERTVSNSYIPFSEYTPLSLSTLSTHDTETLEIWWRDETVDAEEFAKFIHTPYHPHISAAKRKEIVEMVHSSPSIFHVNLIQEYLSLFEDLRWPNPEDERINIPGYVLPSNWTYKTAKSLEEIVAHKGLHSFLKKLAKKRA